MALAHQSIDIASYLDHSLLHPAATPDQINQWCDEADQYHFAAVCICPTYVKQAAERLHNSRVKVCTVIGFPSGTQTTATKLYEAQEAVENGAQELDIVINLGWLKSGKTDPLHREIAEIRQETGCTVKAILEMALLTPQEKRLAAEICMDAGADFLKTSTGWFGGATVADVKLLKEVARDRVGIKASGGIRTYSQAIELILAGATRIGTSRGVDLLRQRDTLEEEGPETP